MVPEKFSEALRAFQSGSFAKADQILRGLLDKERTRDVLHLAGLVKFQLGDSNAAIQLMTEALKIGGFDAPIAINLGKMYQAEQRYLQATRIFERILETSPDDANAIVAMAELCVQQEKWAEAEHWLQKLREQGRMQGNQWLLLAECQHRQGRSYDAFQLLNNLPANAKQHPSVRRALGALAVATGQPGKAIALLSQAVAFDANDVEAGLLLSAAYSKLGDESTSRRVASEALSKTPWMTISKPSKTAAKVVLVTSLMQKTLDTDEQGRLRVNGGHFLTRDLIDVRRFAFDRLYLLPNWKASRAKWQPWHVWVNTISDPDQEYDALKAMCEIAESLDVPVINPPASVMMTTRDSNARRINQLPNIMMPKTCRIVRDGDEKAQILAQGFDFPFLLRETGTQTGTSFELIETEQELDAYLGKTKKDLYAIEFVDVSMTPGVYRRFRLIFVGGQAYPSTCLFHDHWNVHTVNRSRLMAHREDLQKLEQDFLADPERHLGQTNFQALLALPEVIKLDYFGVDFGLRAHDGKVVIFEVNASINHNFDSVPQYPYLKPALERISRAFNDMIESRLNTRR